MGKTIPVKIIGETGDLIFGNRLSRKPKMQDDYEACWQTGLYEDYTCELCPHNFECSGYEERD